MLFRVGQRGAPGCATPADASTAGNVVTEERSEARERSPAGLSPVGTATLVSASHRSTTDTHPTERPKYSETTARAPERAYKRVSQPLSVVTQERLHQTVKRLLDQFSINRAVFNNSDLFGRQSEYLVHDTIQCVVNSENLCFEFLTTTCDFRVPIEGRTHVV